MEDSSLFFEFCFAQEWKITISGTRNNNSVPFQKEFDEKWKECN